jgi:hypothetical protein
MRGSWMSNCEEVRLYIVEDTLNVLIMNNIILPLYLSIDSTTTMHMMKLRVYNIIVLNEELHDDEKN